MPILTQGQVFVATVEPDMLLVDMLFLLLTLTTIVSLIAGYGAERATAGRAIAGLVALASFVSVALLMLVGYPSGFLTQGPTVEAQQSAVPAAQLRELYDLPSQVLPDGMEVERPWEMLDPGVYLVRETGSHQGEDGVFWSVVIENEGGADEPEVEDPAPRSVPDESTDVWVIDGPSVAPDR